jgi:hypothetical protein
MSSVDLIAGGLLPRQLKILGGGFIQSIGGLVASLLDEHVEYLVVDGPPEDHPPAADPDDHLVQVPPAGRLGSRASEVSGELRPELLCPTPDRLAADRNTALGRHLLDVAKAESEPEIKPDGVADNVRREPVALVGDQLASRQITRRLRGPKSRTSLPSRTCQSYPDKPEAVSPLSARTRRSGRGCEG